METQYRNIPPAKIEKWVYDNFDVKPRKGGDELVIRNPFTNSANYKFNISVSKGVCHCWTGDEWAGKINPRTGKRNCSFLNFVKLYLDCSFVEAVKAVLGSSTDANEYLKAKGRTDDSEAVREASVTLPEGARPLARASGKVVDIVVRWLNSRGYTSEDIERHELYYLGASAIWPYFEFDVLVYWQSRSVMNKRFAFPDNEIYEGNKVVARLSVSKSEFFYGFDDVEPASYVIITEAIFDQHTIGDQALASGGAVLCDPQLKKLKILGPTKGIILAPDNDKAGIDSIIDNYEKLSQAGFSKILYTLPPSIEYSKGDKTFYTKDWNELFKEIGMSFWEIRKQLEDGIKLVTPKELIRLRNLKNLK